MARHLVKRCHCWSERACMQGCDYGRSCTQAVRMQRSLTHALSHSNRRQAWLDATSLIRTHPHSVAALTLRARTLAHTQKGGGVRAAQVDLRKAKAMAVRQRNAAAEVNVLLAEAEVYQLASQPRLAMESLKRAARLAPDVWCCAGMEVRGNSANLMCCCVCVCTLSGLAPECSTGLAAAWRP